MRVVSLVPSLTETLLAWGIEPVGVTRFCEHPELPVVGGTKDPDVAAVVALEPDLVLVNDEENRREDFDALVAAGLDVHTVEVRSVADVAPALAVLRHRLRLPPLPAPPPRPPDRAPTTRAFVPVWRRPWVALGGDTYGSSVLAALGVANVFDDPAERESVLDQIDRLDQLRQRGVISQVEFDTKKAQLLERL